MDAKKSYMYRQGNGWIVCAWDERVKMYRASDERPYAIARANVGTDNCRRHNCTIVSHRHEQ